MAAVSASLVVLSQTLTAKEALSGIFGSISLATWVFLLVPQLILNYKTGSAEAISQASLAVWLVGDVTSLAGAVWAGLVPTVIAIAVYFCFADFLLIGQCLYYNTVNARRRRHFSTTSPTSEDEPLLARQRSIDTIGIPGLRRRSSVRSRASEFGHDTLSKILEEEESSNGNSSIRNILSISLVVLAGLGGWFIAWQTGVWVPTPERNLSPDSHLMLVGTNAVTWTARAGTDSLSDPIGAKILGGFSALCYLSARIPQIIKNHQEQSCEGLSLLFFMLSLTGNLTYGAGILFHSQHRDYILKNLPWLIGSLGTMIEDVIIFVQFRIYATRNNSSATVS